MRRPIIGGNWKMNKGDPTEAVETVKQLLSLIKDISEVDIVVCPPFTALTAIKDLLEGTNVKLGAQNMYFEDKGAFTGEISPQFLKAIGCEFVILGHSERRDIFKESDELINKKLLKALSEGLIPIVCIGEHLEEREADKTMDVIKKQMDLTFKGLTAEQMIKTVIAYEPIWAIGTGKTATPEQAEEVHIFIRKLIKEKYDENIANSIRIQYGGSIKPNNAEDLFKCENIDGGLVGGASLDPESFSEIIKSAQKIIK
ncbi:MAG: triose-phosphate isomerase [Promethearchaeota archaeon]